MSTPPSLKNQKKREALLVRRLVDGMAGWLTFKQAGAAKTLYSEYFVYPPLYEIGSGRGWNVVAQAAVTKSIPKKGAPESLDFVFFRDQKGGRGQGAVMMEVKFLRGESSTQELNSLYADFNKLKKVSLTSINNVSLNNLNCTPGKWQLIIAQREAFDRLARSRSKKYKKIVDLLKSARDESLKSVYKSIIETKLKSEFHWHVFAIGEPNWPS
jgi:hypothetical protein